MSYSKPLEITRRGVDVNERGERATLFPLACIRLLLGHGLRTDTVLQFEGAAARPRPPLSLTYRKRIGKLKREVRPRPEEQVTRINGEVEQAPHLGTPLEVGSSAM